jgi:hypothetical protein
MREIIQTTSTIFVKQKKEMAELFGFESRNKYSIETEQGQFIAYVVEDGEGFGATISRQLLGHWRKFNIKFLGQQGEVLFDAHHPFRFYFQRIELRAATGEFIGVLEKKFSIFHKTFDVFDNTGKLLFTMSSPFWRIWTFPFLKEGQQVAVINKKWGGLIKETFLDADSFRVAFESPSLSINEKLLIVTAGIFVDLLYFERKAGSKN